MRFEAQQMRRLVLDMAYAGSTVHIGCAFSIIEILSVLYRNHLRYPDNNPCSKNRDYFLLSKGHGVMAQYACMHEMGWLSDSMLASYFSDGSDLKGLADSRINGIETTSGSLGHGFSVGVGLALGSKIRKTRQKTYVLVGDGEINEGAIWEGALFASHNQLNNLMVIVDENGFQAMGTTKEVMSLGSICDKFASFGFDVATVDGHSEEVIDKEVSNLWSCDSERPKALIAKTIKGKGVSFMENDNRWHYTRLDRDSYQKAIVELSQSDS